MYSTSISPKFCIILSDYFMDVVFSINSIMLKDKPKKNTVQYRGKFFLYIFQSLKQKIKYYLDASIFFCFVNLM